MRDIFQNKYMLMLGYITSVVLIVIGILISGKAIIHQRDHNVKFYTGAVMLTIGIFLLFWLLGAFRVQSSSNSHMSGNDMSVHQEWD